MTLQDNGGGSKGGSQQQRLDFDKPSAKTKRMRKSEEPPSGVTTETMYVDKAQADEWLALPDNRNRKLRPARVDMFCRILKRDEFRLSPDAVALSRPEKREGVRLLNTYHRMTAISRTGLGGWFAVMRHCDPKMIEHTDLQAKRTGADIEKIAHPERKHNAIRQGILQVLYQLEVRQTNSVAQSEREELYKLNKDEVDWVIKNVPPRKGTLLAVLAAIVYAMGTDHNRGVVKFAEQFSGIGINNRNSSALVLRDWLIQHRFERRGVYKPSMIEVARLTLYAIKLMVAPEKKARGKFAVGFSKDHIELYGEAHEFFANRRTKKSPRGSEKG